MDRLSKALADYKQRADQLEKMEQRYRDLRARLEKLAQVAEVIRNDKDLNLRTFQVAGHTDNAKYPAGGPFKDNWLLSLARARQVLLFLISPPGKAGGGGLDPKHWA